MTQDDIRMAHVCVDRPLNLPDLVRASDVAVDVRADNRHELEDVVDLPRQSLALLRGNKWDPGRKLTVGFLSGSKATQDRVFKVMQEWSGFANIEFVRADTVDADIRIAFKPGEGSWSFLGTDILSIKKSRETMNLGWIGPETPDREVGRVVRHEAGHSLGFFHEHQSPGTGGPEWNLPAVYEFFGGPPNNWSHDEVYQQVIEKMSATVSQFTAFDPFSIMCYGFDPPLVRVRIPGNDNFSPLDKQETALIYPRGVVVPPPAPPSDLHVVDVGADGIRGVIPGGPKPAELLLHKAKADSFKISVVVRGTGGHAPIVTLAKSDGDAKKQMKLKKASDGSYITDPMVSRPSGDYLLSIYHPLAGHGGFCWVEAKYAA